VVDLAQAPGPSRAAREGIRSATRTSAFSARPSRGSTPTAGGDLRRRPTIQRSNRMLAKISPPRAPLRDEAVIRCRVRKLEMRCGSETPSRDCGCARCAAPRSPAFTREVAVLRDTIRKMDDNGACATDRSQGPRRSEGHDAMRA